MKLEQHQDSVKEAARPPEEGAGWDPFQVWRTRVREPQLRAQTTPHSPAPAGDPALRKSA